MFRERFPDRSRCLIPDPVPGSGPAEFSDTTGEVKSGATGETDFLTRTGHHERYTTLRGLRCASRSAYARARGQFAVAWRAPTRTRRGFTRNRALCRSLIHRLSQAAAPLAPSTLLAEGRPPLRRFGGRILLTGTPWITVV
jgi:hypothetical protein